MRWEEIVSVSATVLVGQGGRGGGVGVNLPSSRGARQLEGRRIGAASHQHNARPGQGDHTGATRQDSGQQRMAAPLLAALYLIFLLQWLPLS